MKRAYSCLFLLLPVLLLSQEKGASPIPNTSIPNTQSQTYAVIIGISDYEETSIPDLKYADRDAEAFANWLRSPAGGNVTDENIFLHTNKAATNAQMIMSLDWLIEESKEGDRAFIYFSGHGDVERVTKYNNGYLLGYDSPPTVYGAGAFAVNYLKDIISTLSENGVQVILVSDACRAGKLAGSNTNGTQVTTARLSQQFANEIKILSCQPDEFSIEGVQWGGGRGCFSYHLENALYGFADSNDDAEINLMELERYLEDKVSTEAAPESQIPMVLGPPKEKIALVDEQLFAQKQNEIKNKKTDFLAIENKGLEEAIFAETDTNTQKIYNQFLAALDSNCLLFPVGQSANDYYNILLEINNIERLHATIKRKFVVALMDEGQSIINKILQTDPQIVDDVFSPVSNYDHLPDYFSRAADILGSKHYLWSYLKAREYFFKSKTYRAENYPDWSREELTYRAIEILDTALVFDSTASFVYNEMGNIYYWHTGKTKVSLNYFEKALEYSPEWVLPLYMAGRIYFNIKKEYQKGAEYLNRAIALDSTFLPAYIVQSWNNDAEQREYWSSVYLEEMAKFKKAHPGKVPAAYFNYEGNALLWSGKYEEAIIPLMKAYEMSNATMIPVLRNLGVSYMQLGKYKEAEFYLEKALEMKGGVSEEISYFCNKVKIICLNQPDEGYIQYLKNGVVEESTMPNMRNFLLSYYYFRTGQLDSAEFIAKNYYTDNRVAYEFMLGKIEKERGNIETANKHFKKMSNLVPPYDNTIKNDFVIYNKTIAIIELNQTDSLSQLLKKWEIESSYDPQFYFNISRAYGTCNNIDASLEWLELAFKKGWKPRYPKSYEDFHNIGFVEILQSRKFKSLIKQYFPEMVSD